jgi:hypothetical protein
MSLGRSGVNFTKALQAAFMFAGTKGAKRHWWLDCIFAHSGSESIKVAHKHFGEIDPRFWSYETFRCLFWRLACSS